MLHTDSKKELEADIRNKLCSPKAILEHILAEGKIPDRKFIEKAILSLDQIPLLIDSWVSKHDKGQPVK